MGRAWLTNTFHDSSLPQLWLSKASQIHDLLQRDERGSIDDLLDECGVVGVEAIDNEFLIPTQSTGEGRDGCPEVSACFVHGLFPLGSPPAVGSGSAVLAAR